MPGRLGALLVAALLLSACATRPSPDAGGEEIYELLCARCHGDDLGGGVGPALGPGSEAAASSDEFLRTTITRGRGRMPSFGHTLSEAQVERVIEFLREAQQ